MFNNLEELKQEIISGKTNQEIIQERLDYLNSEEYKSTRQETVRRPGTFQVSFYDGFINNNDFISVNENCTYQADEVEIFNKLIDLIRKNMDKEGFPVKFLGKTINDYFKMNENSPYYELSKYLKSIIPNYKYFARNTLPHIVHQYISSNFKGSIKDFGKGYLYFSYPKLDKNAPNRDDIAKSYLESLDDELSLEATLPISAIRGAGIAACTEYSMLTQNCLAFLGYDTYLLGGQISVNGNQEEHNFNVIKRPGSDKYAIIDIAQYVMNKKIEIENLDELRNIVVNRSTADATELTYTADISKQKQSPLQQRDTELSVLEAEERTISEVETLIDQQKEGQNIGE